MGRVNNRERLSRKIRLLAVAAGICNALISALYLAVALTPLYYLHGYINGSCALLNCRLIYSHTGEAVASPHWSYIRHVSIVFTILSVANLALSISSTIASLRKKTVIVGLHYGSSLSLTILYGLLKGYIRRAIEYDLNRLTIFLKEAVTYRTLAGLILYEGARVKYSLVYELLFKTILPILILALSTVASSIAVSLTLYNAVNEKNRNNSNSRGTGRSSKQYLTIIFIAATLLSLQASAYSYYPLSTIVKPQKPPATLESPQYTYTCVSLTRTSRYSITYTDFETYPVTGWASSGGVWSAVSGVPGAKGNVLRGSDDGRGLAGASHYYYNTDLSGRTSSWIIAKTRWVSDTGWHGLSLLNRLRNRLFAVEIYSTAETTGYLQIWSYNVVTTGWQSHSSVQIPGYNRNNWYVIALYYVVSGTTITFIAHLYGANGEYVTNTSAIINNPNVFNPAYIGVEIDNISSYFDDFLIASQDPRNVYFTNLQAGMIVEIRDNLGNTVGAGATSGTTLSLRIVHDAVVGTGVDGSITTKYPDKYLCGILRIPSTDALLGGDTYNLTVAFITYTSGTNKTSAVVSLGISHTSIYTTVAKALIIKSEKTLYAKLSLTELTAPNTLNLDIWLEGYTASTNISIRNGLPQVRETSLVALKPDLNPVALSGYFTATGGTATIKLKLKLCTSVSEGVCVEYPVTINVS